MMGNLSGFMEIWILWWFVAPFRDKWAFCESVSLRMERRSLPFTSFCGRKNSNREIASYGLESSSNYAQDATFIVHFLVR